MCFARTAFVSSGLALATSLPAFAEDRSKPASPAETASPGTSAETASPSADANEPEVIPEAVTEAKYDVDLPEQKVSAHINWGRQSAEAPGAHGE